MPPVPPANRHFLTVSEELFDSLLQTTAVSAACLNPSLLFDPSFLCQVLSKERSPEGFRHPLAVLPSFSDKTRAASLGSPTRAARLVKRGPSTPLPSSRPRPAQQGSKPPFPHRRRPPHGWPTASAPAHSSCPFSPLLPGAARAPHSLRSAPGPLRRGSPLTASTLCSASAMARPAGGHVRGGKRRRRRRSSLGSVVSAVCVCSLCPAAVVLVGFWRWFLPTPAYGSSSLQPIPATEPRLGQTGPTHSHRTD